MSRPFWAKGGVANGRRIGLAETMPLVQCGSNPSRRLRGNALPEQAVYEDTGCDLYPSCLACPLVKCRYDPAPGPVPRNMERNARIHRRFNEGEKVIRLAESFGLSRRTVFRILSTTHRDGVPS